MTDEQWKDWWDDNVASQVSDELFVPWRQREAFEREYMPRQDGKYVLMPVVVPPMFNAFTDKRSDYQINELYRNELSNKLRELRWRQSVTD